MTLLEKWCAFLKPMKDVLVSLVAKYKVICAPAAPERIGLLARDGNASSVESLVYWEALIASELLTQPKRIVKLTATDCEALAHTEVTLPLATYRQPFPTVIVWLPDEFGAQHAFDQARGVAVPATAFGFEPTARARVKLVVCHHIVLTTESTALVLQAICTNGHYVTTRMLKNDCTIEQGLEQCDEKGYDITLKGDKPPSPEQLIAERKAFRIALNTMLLMTTYGCTRVPDKRDKLRSRLRFTKKPLERFRLTQQLKDMPLYGSSD
jgi:hypothetical protein